VPSWTRRRNRRLQHGEQLLCELAVLGEVGARGERKRVGYVHAKLLSSHALCPLARAERSSLCGLRPCFGWALPFPRTGGAPSAPVDDRREKRYGRPRRSPPAPSHARSDLFRARRAGLLPWGTLTRPWHAGHPVPETAAGTPLPPPSENAGFGMATPLRPPPGPPADWRRPPRPSPAGTMVSSTGPGVPRPTRAPGPRARRARRRCGSRRTRRR
jgi:hypothetical protein